MGIIVKFLWMLPLVIHCAYVTATIQYFPPQIGEGSAQTGTGIFTLQWSATVILSNIILIYLYWRMPRFSDAMLKVPNAAHWLKNSVNKAKLIEHLRQLLEAVLFLINVFFLGIYQWVYQSNVALSAIRLPVVALISGFVAMPLVFILMYMMSTLRQLRTPAPPSDK